MKNLLKTLAVALLTVVTINLVGCSKDPEDLIIGTWNATQVIATTTVSGMGEDWDGTYVDTMSYKDGDYSFTFNEDKSVVIAGYDEEEEESFEEKGTYTLNDKTLVVTMDGQSQELTIVDLDKKNLTLRTSVSMAGAEGSFTMDTEMHFKKAK